MVLDHVAPSYWDTQFGAIGVDIFFVISGFVIVISSSRGGANQTSFREFMRRRFVRIVPLYWMFTLLAFVFGSLRGKHYGLVYLVCSLLFVPCQVGDPHGIYFPVLGVGWSLNYEMFFYVCFAACIALKRYPYLLLPLLLLLSVLGLDQSLAEMPLLSLFNFRLIEFGAGMIAANAFERSWVLRPSAGILICLGSALIVGMNRIDGVSTHMLIWAPCAVAFFFGALALERPFGAHVPRPMLLLGAASCSIYLVHQQFVLAPINLMAG